MQVKIIFPFSTFGHTEYELLEDLILAGVIVPAGFISDGASVPRIFWSLFPPVGRYFAAAVVHDYLLSQGTHRTKCNKIFLTALKELNVAPVPAYTLYMGTVAYRGWLGFKESCKNVYRWIRSKV